jgi:predicted nucleic acid-binding protein
VIAVDTSVVVAALTSWHEAHRASVAVLADTPAIPAHVGLEAYSVLTRLPHPHRIPGAVAAELLDRVFPPNLRLEPPPGVYADLPGLCSSVGIEGGAVYDALVAATAMGHDAVLVSRDRRAVPVYRLVGATVRLIE